MNRREFAAGAVAFAGLNDVFRALAQQPPGAEKPAGDLAHARVFHFDELAVTPNANGGWGRAVIHGTLPTGEFVEVHETMLPPGKMPHNPHKHSNSEFIILRQGKVQYLADGRTDVAEVGDVIFTASNKPHGMKNIGETNALYFVVSIGVQGGSTYVDLKPAV